MAGHSKWANTKYRKERADKKKGKIFSRITKEIMSAVRQGGPDEKSNTKLRIAIQKAKDANMPNENVSRNIKKATSADTKDFFSMTYEIFGHGGVGILVDIFSDNRNRVSSEITIAINEHGGNIAKPGAVSHNFDRKGLFRIPRSAISEEALFELITEAGADDLKTEDESFVVLCKIEDFAKVKEALSKVKIEEAELAFVPRSYVDVTDEIANQNIDLIEYLEGLDDVDTVYHNMQI